MHLIWLFVGFNSSEDEEIIVLDGVLHVWEPKFAKVRGHIKSLQNTYNHAGFHFLSSRSTSKSNLSPWQTKLSPSPTCVSIPRRTIFGSSCIATVSLIICVTRQVVWRLSAVYDVTKFIDEVHCITHILFYGSHTTFSTLEAMKSSSLKLVSGYLAPNRTTIHPTLKARTLLKLSRMSVTQMKHAHSYLACWSEILRRVPT